MEGFLEEAEEAVEVLPSQLYHIRNYPASKRYSYVRGGGGGGGGGGGMLIVVQDEDEDEDVR